MRAIGRELLSSRSKAAARRGRGRGPRARAEQFAGPLPTFPLSTSRPDLPLYRVVPRFPPSSIF